MDDIRSMPDSKKITDEYRTHSVKESKNFEEYWINSVETYNKS